jgi:hypothetical protein
MNNKTAYNPLLRAASAAWAELSTPEACQWYSDRAWSDTLTTWAAIGNICQATFDFGIFCRGVVDGWLSQPEPAEQQQPVALLLANPEPILDPEPPQPGTEMDGQQESFAHPPEVTPTAAKKKASPKGGKRKPAGTALGPAEVGSPIRHAVG